MRYMIVLFCCLSTLAADKVFRSIDEDGNVVFSDQPQRGAQSVETEQVINTYQEPTQAPQLPVPGREKLDEDADTAEDERPASYESLGIASPADDETIRENSGRVIVRATSRPQLHASHYGVLLLDGQPVQSRQSLVFELENVDRGTHTLAVRVQDGAGNLVAESPSIGFHLQRFSIQHGRKPSPPPPSSR